MFRGRELAHMEMGSKKLAHVVEEVKDIGVVEQHPKREGRRMTMIIAPTGK
jgi:translation initiation factor IF-3